MDNAPFASSPATLVEKPIATVLVVDDTPENLTPVSYTHLTLPTTPYV